MVKEPCVEIESFDGVIDRIRVAFPTLRVDVRPATRNVDAAAEIPAQPGLSFRLSLSLQGRDELHLNAGQHFWVEWFPAGKQEVFDQFFDAAAGLISGGYRIVEFCVFGRVVRARLERPRASGGWKAIATWSNLGGLIPWPTKRRVLQNNAP